VLDSALMLQAVTGYDERDPASARVPAPDFAAHVGEDVRGRRVGYARGYTYQDIDPDVVAVMDDALGVLRELGCIVEEVPLPYLEHCVTLQTAVMLPEAATIHYDNLRSAAERLGESALMRLDLGNVIPATSYIRAQQVRGLMRDAYRELFRSYDVIVGPAMPARAGRADSWTMNVNGMEVDLRAVGPEYTGLYNLLGVPAIVVPAGFSSEGTPIGLQLATAWFEEPRLLQLAHAFEQATHWHTLHPPDPVGAASA
jgi:aspartyl-tRNA(Asn)/glutamyl-tRNA(Gln) amidotransferase subunit A